MKRIMTGTVALAAVAIGPHGCQSQQAPAILRPAAVGRPLIARGYTTPLRHGDDHQRRQLAAPCSRNCRIHRVSGSEGPGHRRDVELPHAEVGVIWREQPSVGREDT